MQGEKAKPGIIAMIIRLAAGVDDAGIITSPSLHAFLRFVRLLAFLT